MSDVLTEAEQFFCEHGAYTHAPDEAPEAGRVRCARALAAAEERLKAGPYFIDMQPDPEGWDADVPWDGPVWVVTLYSVADEVEPQVLGALGGVGAYEGDPYLRVVAAELADEHITREVEK